MGEVFSQSAHKQGNPSFHFHAPGSKRRYPCTQTASAVPKYFPSAPVLYWLSHLTSISSLKAKNERETFIFTQLKISRYNPHFFSLFLDEFLEIDLRPIYCSLTAWSSSLQVKWRPLAASFRACSPETL